MPERDGISIPLGSTYLGSNVRIRTARNIDVVKVYPHLDANPIPEHICHEPLPRQWSIAIPLLEGVVTSGSDPHGARNADSDGRPITESD